MGEPCESDHTSFRQPTTLLCFDEIPIWQQDNQYLMTGYRSVQKILHVQYRVRPLTEFARRESASLRTSFASLSYRHNQVINAYTHLLGAVGFGLLPIYFYELDYKRWEYAHIDDLIVLTLYTLAVAICFLFSATYLRSLSVN